MNIDNLNIKKVLLLIVFSIFIYTVFQHIEDLALFVGYIFSIAIPFIIGGVIAFILNIPMRFIEREIINHKILKKINISKSFSRMISLIFSVVLVVLIIFGVINIVVPQLVSTFYSIGYSIKLFVPKFIEFSNALIKSQDILKYIENLKNLDWQTMINYMLNFIKSGGNMLNSTIGIVSTIFSTTLNLIIGFIFAIYVLLQKEKLGKQGTKILFAIMPTKIAENILGVLKLSYKVFTSFVTGQCLEACILGVIFFVVLSIFRMPYALLIGVLIAFTALIPIVGAFIGCFISAFLILMVSPIKALVFIILFLVIQQIEGNLIYPNVVGNSVGLPSIWVLVAVTLGGNLFGVAGMLLFIPLSSVCYTLFKEWVNKMLSKKNIDIDDYIEY